MNDSQSILEAKDLQVIKAGALVLDIPALAVEGREILSLIGPNGAGKTTLLQTHCLSDQAVARRTFF